MTKSTQTKDDTQAATTVRVNVPVPSDLHKRLRIQAIQDEMTIQDTVVAAIEYYVGST